MQLAAATVIDPNMNTRGDCDADSGGGGDDTGSITLGIVAATAQALA